MLETISAMLAGLPLSQYIQANGWVVPTLQSVHILAISIVLASVAMLDLRLAGVIGREQSMRTLTLRFYPWIWGALAVLLATGLLMVVGEPERELLNVLFWTKMVLIVAAVAATAPVRRMVEDRRFRDLPPGKRALIRACATASLILWVGVVICGRWIAYAGGIE